MSDDEDNTQMHEHEISVSGIGGCGWLFFAAVLFMMSYDGEIRCALGNAKECVKFAVAAPKP